MAYATLAENLDNLYTTTWQHMKSEARDNIFDAVPFWFWLKNKGKMKPVEGGRWISEPVVYDKNDNITWLKKGGTTSLSDYEFLSIAKYDWRYVAVPIVRFGVDDQQNRGKAQIINLMNSKMENTKNALISEMETVLFQAKTSGDDEPFGLQDLVQDAPTSNPSGGSVGGISRSAESWWRNQYTNATGKSCSVYLVPYMRTMLNNCMNNLMMDAVDIILTGQHPYELYEDETMEQKQIVNKTLGDAGFQNIQFKGIPMIWSPSCASSAIGTTAGRMYFLNTNFIYWVYDPMLNFDMTEWKAIPNQVNDKAAQIVVACAFLVSRSRCQGVIYNLDTL